jgi:elongation factor G
LKREFNLEVNRGKPQVAYKEAITEEIRIREVYKKQTGGKGKFADIDVIVSPAGKDTRGLEFVDEIRGGALPDEFVRAVKRGFQSSMMNGVLAGFPVENLKVRLVDGTTHPVDSDAIAFEAAAAAAFKNACREAGSVLLEPIMELVINTPDEYVGDLSSDLNRRRGQLDNVESRLGYQVMSAKVPLAEMFGYVTTLRTITSGRATSSMEFLAYRQVPRDLIEEILYKIKGYVVNFK